MPWTTYLANIALNLALKGTAYPSKPTNLYFGLLTSMPTSAGGGTEVSGSGYARVLQTATAAAANFEMTLGANDSATAGNHLFNAKVIQWNRPLASWGSVVAFGIYDAISGGNLLMYEPLPTGVAIDAYQRPFFAIRSLEFSIGGSCGAHLEQAFLNHLLRGVTFTSMTATLRAALGTAAGSSTGFPNEVTVTTHYTRPAIGSTVFGVASGGASVNAAAINFVFAAANPGYTVTHYALINHATAAGAAANMVWQGTLSSPTIVAPAAQTHTWDIGDATLPFQV
jgi:hypothetical protein